jgi:hypothetical protein
MKPHRPVTGPTWHVCAVCKRPAVWVEQRGSTAGHLRHWPKHKHIEFAYVEPPVKPMDGLGMGVIAQSLGLL